MSEVRTALGTKAASHRGAAAVIVGFTGTKQGTTREQRQSIRRLLKELGCTELRHGDCVGADAEVHSIALAYGIRVVVHPPVNPKYRANCAGAAAVLREADYMVRNQHIVDASEVLVAAPFKDVEPGADVRRPGGTWATVRRARGSNRKIYVVLRDGAIQVEERQHAV